MFLTISTLLMAIYLFSLFILGRGFKSVQKAARSNLRLSVSVVVSAHNEVINLPELLQRLAKQNYPRNLLEFIIVNDRSADQTAAVIRNFTHKDDRFRYIEINDRIAEFAPKKRAIDQAIQIAQGDIILLTDADGRPGNDWVKTMASYFTEDTDMVIGYAPYSVNPPRHFTKQLLALEYLSHAAMAAASSGTGFPLTCVGTNMAYRKKVYRDIDGFGQYKTYISGDDDLFLTRVRESGKYKIKYATEGAGHVFNDPPRLWSNFLHQRMRYASKGFSYPLKVTTGLIVYFLFNLFLLIGLSGVLFNWQLFRYSFLVLAIKSLADFLFMRRAGITLNDTRFIHLIPIAELFHVPYIVTFGLLGQFRRFRWAGSEAEHSIQQTELINRK